MSALGNVLEVLEPHEEYHIRGPPCGFPILVGRIFLPGNQVDRIIVMGELPGVEGATVVDQGTYQELVSRGRDLTNILQERRRPPTVVVEPEARMATELGSEDGVPQEVGFSGRR